MSAKHVYVHVPFCARRCSYCDFSIAVRSRVPVDDFVDGVARELRIRLPEQTQKPIDTLYLGGGTPSQLGPDGIARLLDVLRSRIDIAHAREITIEANPDDISADAVRAFRDAGVNRISLGAQSFDDRVLQWMHRTHDAASIERAAESIRAGGIDNWSLDLIFALPPELARDWERDLARAIALTPTHVSLYGLTVEPHTPLGRWRERDEISEAPEERYESEFLAAHDALAGAGFEHYEVSNYGLPGRRALHNSSYWRGVPYFGLGPSSHGYDGETRRWNESAYAHWLERVRSDTDPIAGSERLDEDAYAAEAVYLGLRTADGLQLTDVDRGVVAPWIVQGWATSDASGRFRLTPLGWLRLDALAVALTASRSL